MSYSFCCVNKLTSHSMLTIGRFSIYRRTPETLILKVGGRKIPTRALSVGPLDVADIMPLQCNVTFLIVKKTTVFGYSIICPLYV